MEPEAGLELDRKIAREILCVEPGDTVPSYSSDDATAAALAARFSREFGWWHFEKKEIYGGWSVGWIEEGQPYLHSVYPVRSSAPSRALAICRSILKVASVVQSRRHPAIPPSAVRQIQSA